MVNRIWLMMLAVILIASSFIVVLSSSPRGIGTDQWNRPGIDWRSVEYLPIDNILVVAFDYSIDPYWGIEISKITPTVHFFPDDVFQMGDFPEGLVSAGVSRPNWGAVQRLELWGHGSDGQFYLMATYTIEDIKLMSNGGS